MMCNDPAAKGCWYKSMLVFSLVIFASTGNAAWQSNEPPGVEVTDFALAPSKPATVIATSEVGNRGIYLDYLRCQLESQQREQPRLLWSCD